MRCRTNFPVGFCARLSVAATVRLRARAAGARCTCPVHISKYGPVLPAGCAACSQPRAGHAPHLASGGALCRLPHFAHVLLCVSAFLQFIVCRGAGCVCMRCVHGRPLGLGAEVVPRQRACSAWRARTSSAEYGILDFCRGVASSGAEVRTCSPSALLS